MRANEIRRYEMLVRVRDFGAAHRDRFPESSVGGQAFATVAEAVTQLSGHAVSKMSTAREGTGARAMVRESLIEQLETIGRTARVIAEEVPGFNDPFRLPRRRPADQTLLTAGRVFIQDAETVKSEFIGHGMPPTFLAELTELVDKFEQAIRGREAGRDGQTAAQAGIASALSAGLAAVRKLDVIVENQLHEDAVAMAVWHRDRRVNDTRRARRVPAAPSAPVPSAPALSVPSDSAPTPPPAIVKAAKPTATDIAIGVAS